MGIALIGETLIGGSVPKFMDYHEDLKLPAEAILQITQETKDHKSDDFQVYCLLEAPDAEAVRAHHAALGVPCGDVHEVTQLL
jgi:hypothetical protein